ncbi:MAG: GntR family transcriptional regulator [Cetobacterium sp.]
MAIKGKENSRDFVYKILKNKIMCLELIPGDSISEGDFCLELGVSRTPIREVVLKLSHEGLVEVFPQKGTFVSKIDLNAVIEGYEVRKLIEKDVLRCAIENITSKNLNELKKNLYLQKANLEIGEDVVENFQLDNEFHKIIYNIASRKRTWEGLRNIAIHYDRIRFLDAVDKIGIAHKILEQHNEIYSLLENKDNSKIDRIVEEHLSNFKEKIENFKLKYPKYFKK